MKPDYDLIFGNFFDDYRISDSRFFTFADNSLNNIIAANTNNVYNGTIAQLTPLIAVFGNELGDVAFALNKQKGDTNTTDQLLDEFIATMRAKEAEISYKLGGKGTPAYLLFYPRGITQYSQATKGAMPVLTNQLAKAATAHSAQLGAELTNLLTGFATRWKATRDSQQQQMGSVESNRIERTKARRNLEMGLLDAIHTVALSSTGNVELGKNLFKFELLFGQTHHEHEDFKGTIGVGEIREIMNRMLHKEAVVRVRNTGSNAPIAVYCGVAANAPAPASAAVLNPGDSSEFTPYVLGNNSQCPFLLIKNVSEVNDSSFEVEIIG